MGLIAQIKLSIVSENEKDPVFRHRESFLILIYQGVLAISGTRSLPVAQ